MSGARYLGSRAIVPVALLAGFAAGCLVMSLGQPRPKFLGDVQPLAQKDEANQVGRDTVSYFSVQGDWNQLFQKAKAEMPTALERETTIAGMRAKVLTIPRFEDGRMQTFFPPDEEITFLPRRLALNREGKVIAVGDSAKLWTGVQLRVYRKPVPYDNMVEWVHKTFRV